jgi:tetratricopeptide (TPR) repeat protein
VPWGPELPEGVTWTDLDPAVRAQLRDMPLTLAERVGGHLAAAGVLLQADPDLAYEHAQTARRLAQRVAAVREAAGITAYATGRWAEAIGELRAYRRFTGSAVHLPIIADCERALGRPERALEVAADPAAGELEPSAALELLLVQAGARRDLGQPEAALRLLDVSALRAGGRPSWLPRLRYAYADTLLELGRPDEARTWFAEAAQVDPEATTDAAERLLELDGTVFVDAVEMESDLQEPDHQESDGSDVPTSG